MTRASEQGRASRRGFLRTAAWGATLGTFAALGGSERRRGNGPAPHSREAATPLDPDLLMLVKRATQGFSLAEYHRAAAMGYDAWLEWQLAPERIEDEALENRLRRFRTLTATPKDMHAALMARLVTPARIYRELVEATLLRSILSGRQLHERMVEFWTNHFNIDQSEPAMQFLAATWDHCVIRKHAMGNFADLLAATSRDGAMLFYLDNYTNRVGRPQENYARELLELHCLGRDGGYSERDVREVARILTGWTVHPIENADAGAYRFDAQMHDGGEKQVMRIRVPATGESEGKRLLAHLSTHPRTARFVSTKLARWFLGESPAAWVVAAAADAFLATNGDVRAMLRVVLSREAIRTAGPKIRQPRGYLTSLLRSTACEIEVVRDSDSIVEDLLALGQAVYRWPAPDGFPDTLAGWGKGLLPRWTFASNLFDGRVAQAKPDPERLLASAGAGPGRQAWGMNMILTGGTMTPREQDIVQRFIGAHGATETAVREGFALAASSSSVQVF